jgi:hypothetical protein
MGSSRAIIIGAALIAAAILFVFRWEIITGGGYSPLRLDRWTGKVTACRQAADFDTNHQENCSGH